MENKDIKSLKFEEAMAELENVVSTLQDGDIDLEESTKLYERGMLLKKHCDSLLDDTKMKIEEITKDKSGKIEKKKFE